MSESDGYELRRIAYKDAGERESVIAKLASLSGVLVEDAIHHDESPYLIFRIPSTLEQMKRDKLAELAEARWLEETGGLTLLDGTTIKTDRESQALLTGASLYALQNATATVEWKGASGWITLTAAQIQGIAMAVRNHVQAAFSREKELAAKVEACETIEGVDAVTW